MGGGGGDGGDGDCSAKVQIGAELLWKGEKVNAKIGRGVVGQITECGVQITEGR